MGHGQMINAPETSSCRKLVQAADGEVLVKGGLSDAEMLRALILWDQTRCMDLCVFSRMFLHIIGALQILKVNCTLTLKCSKILNPRP